MKKRQQSVIENALFDIPFTNTCKGEGPDAKRISSKKKKKKIDSPLQDLQKFQAPFFAMKITGQPHKKANRPTLIFLLEICGIFFSRQS